MGTIEKFLILFFAAIIIGIVARNPSGTKGLFDGLTGLSTGIVNAFSGGRGFA